MSEHLLHPELVELIPLRGTAVANILDERAAEVAASDTPESNISFVVRALNEAGPLEGLLQDVSRMKFSKEVELIVVDNESSDGTADVAREYGATVVTIPRGEFTHPKSMNIGVEAASFNNVFLTVGHARLSNDQLLRAGSQHFDAADMAGVFSATLPNGNASTTERLIAIGTPSVMSQKQIKKAGMGVLGATNAMISKEAWRDLGTFDERYERGGEDTHMAGLMLRAGLKVVRDPALAVHHTHGLSALNFAKQARQWQQTLKAPQTFDAAQWAKRRPDLDLS